MSHTPPALIPVEQKAVLVSCDEIVLNRWHQEEVLYKEMRNQVEKGRVKGIKRSL